MARRAAAKPKPPQRAWLITYSDLVTLLLAFFVLVVSMSTVDRPRLESIAAGVRPAMTGGSAPKRSERTRQVGDMLLNASALRENQVELRNTLFPAEILPPGIDTRRIEQDVEIQARPEGVAIVLADDLLFPPGSARIPDGSRGLLSTLAGVLVYLGKDVNVSGHAEGPVPGDQDPWELSGKRGLAVLEYFLQMGLAPERFSVSGYGPDRPAAGDGSGGGGLRPHRVEILVKTTGRGYPG